MDSTYYFNPYSGKHFFGVIFQLFSRLLAFISGDLPLSALASDEIQIIVLSTIAASSALVGTFLILRKMTMLANSISHTILLGIVFAFLFVNQGDEGHIGLINTQVMLPAALFMGLFTAFLTEVLSKGARLQEDASTGLVFTSLFAIGIVFLTLLTKNAHIGTEVIMGNVDALQLQDCELSFLVLGMNLLIFGFFFKEFTITTFDSGLARALGISPVIFTYLLMALVSTTAISAFRAVGVLMVLTFFVGPPLIAALFTNNLKMRLFLSVSIGIIASIIGVALTRHILTTHGIPLSTAGVIVSTIVLSYILIALFIRLRYSNKKLTRSH